LLAELAGQYRWARRKQLDFSLDRYNLTQEEKHQVIDTYKIEQLFHFLRENYDPETITEVLYGQNGNSTNGKVNR